MHSVANLATLHTLLATFFPSKKRPSIIFFLRVACMLRSRGKTLFEEGEVTSVTCGTCPASAEVERWLCSWESQMDQMEGMKTGETLSSPFPFRSNAHSLRSEARPAVLPL